MRHTVWRLWTWLHNGEKSGVSQCSYLRVKPVSMRSESGQWVQSRILDVLYHYTLTKKALPQEQWKRLFISHSPVIQPALLFIGGQHGSSTTLQGFQQGSCLDCSLSRKQQHICLLVWAAMTTWTPMFFTMIVLAIADISLLSSVLIGAPPLPLWSADSHTLAIELAVPQYLAQLTFNHFCKKHTETLISKC